MAKKERKSVRNPHRFYPLPEYSEQMSGCNGRSSSERGITEVYVEERNELTWGGTQGVFAVS